MFDLPNTLYSWTFKVEVQNKCPIGMACINNDENKNTVIAPKCTCGMPFSPRIVGGMEAGRNSIPWQVIHDKR